MFKVRNEPHLMWESLHPTKQQMTEKESKKQYKFQMKQHSLNPWLYQNSEENDVTSDVCIKGGKKSYHYESNGNDVTEFNDNSSSSLLGKIHWPYLTRKIFKKENKM